MSSKKLHEILNPSFTSLKDGEKLMSFNNYGPFMRQNQVHPTSSSPCTTYSNTPALYMALPKNQNIFYDPIFTSHHEPICPSPLFQLSLNTRSKIYLPGSLMESYLAAETSEENTLNNKNKYNRASIDSHSNHQFHTGSTIQPKNLQELLKRSFSTVPSNSPFQASFHSVMPSPFLSHGTPNSRFCTSTALKIGTQCSSGILGTPLQNPRILQDKNMNSCQPTEIKSQGTLISQLDKLSGKENEQTITHNFCQLLARFQNFGVITEEILNKEATIFSHIYQAKYTDQKSTQQDYYKNQILKLLNSPKEFDLMHIKSESPQQRLENQLTESQIQLLNNAMIQDSQISNDNYEIDTEPVKIGSWVKKTLLKKNLQRRGKVMGKRPRIKGRFITLEEYVEYRKVKSDIQYNNARLNWNKSPFEDNDL